MHDACGSYDVRCDAWAHFVMFQENHIFYGLGYKSQGDWQHIIRDIGVDIQKGVSGGGSKKKQQKVPRSKLILESLSISNVNSFDAPLLVDNVTLSSTEHMPQFFQAVDWFVDNQDSQGGWPIPVSRKFNQASNFYPTLRPGWYSAMGQGHGLSLLARAYALTKDSKYASACEKALRTIFDHPGTENLGVRAIFMDEYVWYEEYPTTPSSFVLNGNWKRVWNQLLGFQNTERFFPTRVHLLSPRLIRCPHAPNPRGYGEGKTTLQWRDSESDQNASALRHWKWDVLRSATFHSAWDRSELSSTRLPRHAYQPTPNFGNHSWWSHFWNDCRTVDSVQRRRTGPSQLTPSLPNFLSLSYN